MTARIPFNQLIAPVTLLGIALSAPAVAQIHVTPSVNVRETYTDNPGLGTGQGDGQFISEISPAISALINTPRVKLIANLDGHLYNYWGDRPGNTNSAGLQFSTSGKANLIEDFLYVDGSASRSRQNISAFGQQSDNGYTNNNSDEVTSWRISPYFVQRFGNIASGQLRYSRDSVHSGSGRLADSTGDSVNLNLDSGPAFTTVGWNLAAYHQSVTDPIAGQSDTDNVVATLRFRLKSSLSTYLNAGYDRYSYEGLGGTSGGKSFAAGFTWTPSQRTSIDASIGRRYFGKTYSLAAVVRSRRTIWNASYHDDITTARGQFLRTSSFDTASLLDASFAAAFPDPLERRQAILAYLAATGLPTTVVNNINYFSNRLFLQKQFLGSFVLNGSKSALIASVANTRRTALTPAGVDAPLSTDIALGDLNNNVHQLSASLALNYRLSSKTAATLSTTKSRSLSTTTNIRQNQTNASFSVNHKFARKLTGAVELRHSQGETVGFSNGTYRENAISASLNYQL